MPSPGVSAASLFPTARCRSAAPPAVADNTLTIKQKSTLPVSKTRQDKSLFRSLPGTYPPPLESGFRRICSAATSPSWTSVAAPAPLQSATSFRLRPPPYMTTCAVAAAACGPGAKMSLAYATGPFSVPHGPAGAPRTTGGQILYGALQPPPQNSPWLIAEVRPPTRCEPIPAFPLLPETPTCLAWPSAASTSARCEPFSPNRLTPASCDSGSRPGTMAAGAREQAASCDAFVLSRRQPASDAPLSNRQKTSCITLGNLFGQYSFFHQSCATGTLPLQKEIYPQKSLPNLR